MLVVKSLRAEPFEVRIFRQLAEANRTAQLAKRREKALFPEAITAAYAAAVVALLLAGAVAVQGGAMTGGGIVAFFTSLVLLVEPIQVEGRDRTPDSGERRVIMMGTHEGGAILSLELVILACLRL